MGNQLIHASFDLKFTKDPESEYYSVAPQRFNILNGISKSIPINITSNQFNLEKKLVISTNGIDGYGFENNDFNISPIYYVGQKIYFVCRIKTLDNFPVKNIPSLSLSSSNFNFSLSAVKDENGNEIPYTITDENIDGVEYSGGYFKGSITIDEIPLSAKNIKLYPVVKTTTFGVLKGESNTFNVHPKAGLYDYRKINEDNDQEQTYKNLRFQNILQNTNDFFTNFLGEIVGDKNSTPDSLGIKIYEKISNFTANNADINTSNIDGLLSMLESIEIDYETYNIELPASLSRIVDNLSISLSLQKGNINYYNSDFDNKGQIISNVLGINKGKELPLMSTLLQTGDNAKPIVAYEKFSNRYTLLDTNLLSCFDFRYLYPETNTYALSDYNKYWGWGLVLPPQIGLVDDYFILENTTYNSSTGQSLYQNVLKFQDNFGRLTTQEYEKEKRDPSNILNFYTFYEYLSTPEGSNIQKYIDYDNPNTYMGNLTSYSEYIGPGGVVDDIILNNLVTNTVFITGTTSIQPLTIDNN